MDLTKTSHSGMDFAELAAEYVELLPERITLMLFQNGQSVGTGNNSPVNSPGSNNVVTGNSSMVQTVGNYGAFINSIASGDTFLNQW
ncbi:hypothetical protein [Pseudofrankia inefficax]|uniref:Uncharacterized protein n=1 Tax=Pseudofrankia inefficax (strain DSM 45817 / CECT 9037 / DDB 130130 / EuI1c) TaxID=298654 RepID=E3J7K2_PSEI1|nr:hypothetical protein [Pseudofrankia inefficax]ADP79611.1 hypothetical protein FraEuI1c_1549 [Pseudofrankia inefficax]